MSVIKITQTKDTVTSDNQGIYPIKPAHINTDRKFKDAFGESSGAARGLCKFFQAQSQWCFFTLDDLAQYWGYKKKDYLQGLINLGYIKIKGETYEVTHEFICICFKASPHIVSEQK